METKLIGNKIAEARKKATISQAQLAERLFISPQAVGKWERGESMPDIITLNRLAEIMGVDLNYFSENFQSAATEIAPVEPLVKQSAELPSGKAGKKLSWDMSRGNWVDADFSGLKDLHEKFSSSNMQRCKFIGSDLSGLLLKTNNVDSCDFSGSDISNSRIQLSHLNKNIFKECTLKDAEFSRSHIHVCDFTGADFTGTKFSESYLYGCDFNGANFTGMVIKSGGFTGVVAKSGDLEKNAIANAVWNRTSFIDSQIADIVFTGALDDCYFENCVFKTVTFRNAMLTNTFFKNKSLKGMLFIDCQADRMTYEFLKNGKADLTGIRLLTS
ncbi:MAG: pentapeptide repeat-containing protein [Bacteroidota bacterium]|nr:pentapeptide repeat-containing protein [Bacteroidota bacterium]